MRTIDVTNSHFFSEHLKRSNSFDDIQTFKDKSFEVNRSTNLRCEAHFKFFEGLNQSSDEHKRKVWEGEDLYCSGYAPLAIVKLAEVDGRVRQVQPRLIGS
jgi:hypothetical protein